MLIFISNLIFIFCVMGFVFCLYTVISLGEPEKYVRKFIEYSIPVIFLIIIYLSLDMIWRIVNG
jgi:hypothetical protein